MNQPSLQSRSKVELYEWRHMSGAAFESGLRPRANVESKSRRINLK